MYLYGVLLCILFAFLPCEGSLTIENGALNGTVFRSAQMYTKGDDFVSRFATFSGSLVHSTSAELDGNIVYLELIAAQTFYPTVFELQDKGVIGIVYATEVDVPGQFFCQWNGEDMTLVHVPIAEISIRETEQIRQSLLANEPVQISVTSEGNPWVDAIHSIAVLVVLRIILTALGFLLFCWSFYKLVNFIRVQGPRFNVPQVCLALEVLANLWRILYTAVDPFGCYFVFGSVVGSFLDSVSLPYEFATFVLISFYWHEMLGDSIKINPFLKKLIIPFFVITIALMVADLLISVLGRIYSFPQTAALVAIYLVVSVGFLIFYCVTARRIVVHLQKKELLKVAMDSKRIKRIKKLNNKMIMNAVSRGCLIAIGILFFFPQISNYPVPQVVLTAFVMAIVIVDSAARINLFSVPKS